jgi:hypothetical protein
MRICTFLHILESFVPFRQAVRFCELRLARPEAANAVSGKSASRKVEGKNRGTVKNVVRVDFSPEVLSERLTSLLCGSDCGRSHKAHTGTSLAVC